jgi:hypothetical protein
VIFRGGWQDWTDLRRCVLASSDVLERVQRVCRPHLANGYAQRYHFWMNYAQARSPAQRPNIAAAGWVGLGAVGIGDSPTLPLSRDADHVLTDLRVRFGAVLNQLKSVAGWKTARVQRPVQILGSLDGIETSVRQLIREQSLETMVFEHAGEKLTLNLIGIWPQCHYLKSFPFDKLRANGWRWWFKLIKVVPWESDPNYSSDPAWWPGGGDVPQAAEQSDLELIDCICILSYTKHLESVASYTWRETKIS